jgi:hypothetical protein
MTTATALIAAATTLGAGAALLLRDSPQPPANERVFTELCDASAGLLLDARHLVVLNDEDPKTTLFRVYDLQAPGKPVKTIDATAALGPEGDDLEVDLEGLTRFGSRFALIGSHSRKGDKDGKGEPAPSRRRLLAFELGAGPGFPLGGGKRYVTLVEDAQAFLATQPEPLKSFVLNPERPSKDGGLSIEALAETPAGELLIGLRSPLGPDTKALVLVLQNAAAVLDTKAKAMFGPPILLDLKQQGLRDLVSDGKGGFLILAGDPGEGGAFALWAWSGPSGTAPPRRLMAIANVPDTSAEGIAVTPDKTAAWILFDEGERKTASGKKCKGGSVAPADKSFRARRVALP